MDLAHFKDPDAWIGLAVLLSLGLTVYIAAISFFTLWRLRHPPRRTYSYAVARNIPGDPAEISPETPVFKTVPVLCDLAGRKRTIDTWVINGDDPTGPVVVVTHGWGSCRIDMLNRFIAIRPFASRVVLWDMAGHGETPGPCTLGTREPHDLACVIRDAAIEADDQATSIVLFGYSLGAEVTMKVLPILKSCGISASRVSGVILEAPYRKGMTPARAVLDASKFPSFINLPLAMIGSCLLNGVAPNERWRDLTDLMEDFDATAQRLLILHGANDMISPIDDGRAIAASANGNCVEVDEAGHKDLFPAIGEPQREQVAAAFSEFFRSLDKPESS